MDELDKIHRILDNVFYQNCCSYFEIYLSSHLVLYTTAEYARYASSLGTQGERPWLVGRDLTGPEHREAIWHPSSGMSYAVDQMDIENKASGGATFDIKFWALANSLADPYQHAQQPYKEPVCGKPVYKGAIQVSNNVIMAHTPEVGNSILETVKGLSDVDWSDIFPEPLT
jgi:hypothetical protein